MRQDQVYIILVLISILKPHDVPVIEPRHDSYLPVDRIQRLCITYTRLSMPIQFGCPQPQEPVFVNNLDGDMTPIHLIVNFVDSGLAAEGHTQVCEGVPLVKQPVFGCVTRCNAPLKVPGVPTLFPGILCRFRLKCSHLFGVILFFYFKF